MNAKIKAHQIFRYLEQSEYQLEQSINSSICSSGISVSIAALLRESPTKTNVLVKFELF